MTTNNNNSSSDGGSVAVQDNNEKDNPFAEYMWMREEDEFNKEASWLLSDLYMLRFECYSFLAENSQYLEQCFLGSSKS